MWPWCGRVAGGWLHGETEWARWAELSTQGVRGPSAALREKYCESWSRESSGTCPRRRMKQRQPPRCLVLMETLQACDDPGSCAAGRGKKIRRLIIFVLPVKKWKCHFEIFTRVVQILRLCVKDLKSYRAKLGATETTDDLITLHWRVEELPGAQIMLLLEGMFEVMSVSNWAHVNIWDTYFFNCLLQYLGINDDISH